MALGQVFEPVLSKFRSGREFIVRKFLGHNNENLDLVMDTFNKLEPQKRAVVIAVSCLAVVVFVMGMFFVYFKQVDNLETKLSRRQLDLYKLNSLGSLYSQETSKFDDLKNSISKKVSNLRVKAELEKIANAVGVRIESIDEQSTDLPRTNPLGKSFKKLQADVRLSKVSIPELLDLVVKIEKSDRLFQIGDLIVRGRYGTKLYFDAQFKVNGYLSSENI